MTDAKEAPADISAAASAAKGSDEKSAQDAPVADDVPTTAGTADANAAAAPPTATSSSEAETAGLSVTIPAPQSSDDAAAPAAAPSPISKSPTGAYVNPAMRKMLEKQEAAKKQRGGGGFGSFLFGGGGSGSRRSSKNDQEGAADIDHGDDITTAKDPPKKQQNASSPADIGQSSSKEDGDEGDTTYEHGLRPGDHVYRWSHFGFTYPIQIHGIVLDTSPDASEEEEEEKGEEKGDEKNTNDAKGDNANADTSGDGKEEGEEAASLPLPAPKCKKIVWVKIADFGFTRKGDDDNDDGGGNERGDDADADSNGGPTQEQTKRHRHQEHADGIATAPASLHSSSNDLGGQNEADTDVQAGADADANAADVNTDETQTKDSDDTDGGATSASTTCANGEEPTDNKSTEKPPRPKSLKKSEESFLAQHLKKGKRLNVITLTDPKDIKKWRKVNYGGKGLFGGGDDENIDNKSDEGKGKEVAVDDENSDKNTATKKEAGGNRFTSWLRSNPSSRCTSPTTTEAEAQTGNDATASESTSVQATPSTDFGDLDAKETSEQEDQAAPSSFESNNKATQGSEQTSPEEISEHSSTSATPTNETNPDETEPKTLEEMVAAANAVDLKARQSPRRKAPEDATEAKSSGKEDEADKKVRKSSSLANIWPFKKTGDAKDTSEESGDGDKNNKQSDPSTASKSDAAKIVLARVLFLLENEDDVLPAYHVFNSNSECIAVWCKTGRWSSLQSDVFWHTTAIGNAKSTTLMGLSLAATQPWLIPALPVAAVAAIGTPYLVLRQSKKKCEEATRQLTDGFWAQADPEVYVEAIETWSGIPA